MEMHEFRQWKSNVHMRIMWKVCFSLMKNTTKTKKKTTATTRSPHNWAWSSLMQSLCNVYIINDNVGIQHIHSYNFFRWDLQLKVL